MAQEKLRIQLSSLSLGLAVLHGQRVLGHESESRRRRPRGASLQLRGFGSQHAAHDLYPPTPFDAILAALLPSVDAPDEFDDLPLLLDAKDVEAETEMV